MYFWNDAKWIAQKNLAKRLKVYQGSEHPHTAQNPITLEELKF